MNETRQEIQQNNEYGTRMLCSYFASSAITSLIIGHGVGKGNILGHIMPYKIITVTALSTVIHIFV
jgi:hypothetical protein